MSSRKRFLNIIAEKFDQDPQVDASTQPLLVWEYALMAAVLAGFLATQIKLDFALKYPQLIVGDLVWNAGNKSGDYLMPLLGLAYGISFYILMQWLDRRIHRKLGWQSLCVYRQTATYSLIPASFWLASQFIGGDSLVLIWISVIVIVTLLICAVTATCAEFHWYSARHFATALTASAMIPLLAPISLISAFVVKRFLDPSSPPDSDSLMVGIYISLGIGLLVTSLIWLIYQRHGLHLQQGLNWALLAIQVLIPGLFLIVFPLSGLTEQGEPVGFTATPPLVALVIGLGLWSYGDLWQRGRRLWLAQSHPHKTFILPISLPIVLAILLFLKMASPRPIVPNLSIDDYHFGEFLLPWWLWSDFGQLPFQDYFPARGLINYVPGFLADFFLDGTAAALKTILGGPILALPYLAIALILIRRSIGLLPAFIVLLIMPAPGGMFEIHLMLTAGLCFLVELFQKQRWVQWLAFWGGVGIVFVLFAPGQGGLFILGTVPLGGVALYQAFRRSPNQLVRWFGGFTAAAAVLCLFTPLDQMVLGAVQYVTEQSETNSTAYGYAWKQSRGSNPVLGYPLWELLRTAWLWVGGLAAILIYRIFGDRSWPDRQRYLAFAIPIVLFSLLWIPRAAGRIDPGASSRLGIVSVWFISLLLPLLLIAAFGKGHHARVLIVVALAAGVMSNPVGHINVTASLEQALAYPSQSSIINPVEMTEVQQLDLPNIGAVNMTPEQISRFSLLKAVIGEVVDPGETYLDLTSRNAQYFYLGYRVPIESGAAYNLVHVKQQQRAIRDLEEDLPPIALVFGKNFGFSSALRPHLLYRYVVHHYIPVKIEDYIFMVRPDRLARLNPKFLMDNGLQAKSAVLNTYKGDPADLSLNAAGYSLLDISFFVPDLRALPSSWGRSWTTLHSEVELVHNVHVETLVTLRDLNEIASNEYQVSGDKPQFVVDLTTLNLAGTDAGLLVFDFRCTAERSRTELGLYWQDEGDIPAKAPSRSLQFTAHNGLQIVPLDAAPRWLTASQLQRVQIAPVDASTCPRFTIRNLRLMQRRAVNEVATALQP